MFHSEAASTLEQIQTEIDSGVIEGICYRALDNVRIGAER
jgi:hypothetical protein